MAAVCRGNSDRGVFPDGDLRARAIPYGDTKNIYIKGASDIRFGIDIRGGVDVTVHARRRCGGHPTPR